jgi:hypothetical protein
VGGNGQGALDPQQQQAQQQQAQQMNPAVPQASPLIRESSSGLSTAAAEGGMQQTVPKNAKHAHAVWRWLEKNGMEVYVLSLCVACVLCPCWLMKNSIFRIASVTWTVENCPCR